MKSQTVLAVRIDDLSIKESVIEVNRWIQFYTKKKIFTPNPEFLMYAQKDQEFQEVLNSSDLNIPDGNGLKLSGKVHNNTPGVDLMESLIKEASEKGYTIGLLGGNKGLAERLANCLKNKYPNLRINFASSDIVVNSYGFQIKPEQKIKIPSLDILFVALGHPKQEKWIYQNIASMPVKIAMGVGGSFDYLAGEVKRAPLFIRNLKLEWLYRLITEPWRFKRQLVLIEYFYLVLKERFLR